MKKAGLAAILWMLPLGIVEARGASVLVVRVKDVIHPITAEFIKQSLAAAAADGRDLVVLELDTPGGLVTSTRDITTAILNSTVPVAVFVSPSGAQAASAGFIILISADIAAMAPGTNAGAAHPVSGDGGDIGETMNQKIENDVAAMVRTLAAKRGRNVEEAENGVRESVSFTEREALDFKLIDYVARDLPDLLAQLEGRKVTRADGAEVVLSLKRAAVVRREMSLPQKFLAVLATPNIALILMMIGMLGIYVEITTPGAIFPGVAGGICLLLAFFALSVLPINYVGLALIALAAVLFVAEIKVVSHGVLGLGGATALIIGSLMLVDGPIPALRVSPALVVLLGAFVVAVGALLTYLVVGTHQRKPTTGEAGIIGEVGVAQTDLAPTGKVFMHGEIWDAEASEAVLRGERVEALAIAGMTLKVRRKVA